LDIVGTVGPWFVLIIVGGFVFFMTQKKGWKWQQIVSGALLMAALYGQFPALPQAVNTGMTNIVRVFTG